MKNLKSKIFVICLFVIIAFFYFYNIGNNPAGFFCDEALFAIRAKQLLDGNFKEIVSPFFNFHFGFLEGNFFFYPLVPFVFTMGLNEFSVRFASVFFTVISLPIFYLSLKKLGVKNILIPILIYTLTPFVVHISRIYMAMTPSIFMMTLSYYLYLKNQRGSKLKYSIAGGFILGVSVYGYNPFIVSAFLLIISLVVSEIISSRKLIFRNRGLIYFIISYLLISIPIFTNAYINPQFFNRLRVKNQNFSELSLERTAGMLQKYPKYFDINYLAKSGEAYFPNVYIQRHTITGAGIYLKTTVVIIFISYILFLFTRNNNKKYFAPLFILFLLHPIPDLISTPTTSPPYTFPLSATIFVIPFIIGYGIDHLLKPATNIKNTSIIQTLVSYISILLIVISLIEGLFFIAVTYQKYPLYSSGYWGWQYGPKEIINYFIENKDNYDYMCMEGVFNEPQIFIQFYDYENRCNGKCGVCSIYDRRTSSTNRLYAVSTDSFLKFSKGKVEGVDYLLKKIMHYPNGQPAFYLIAPSVDSLTR